MAVRTNRWTKQSHRFHRDEDGGAYTLSYVMVIPFLMMLIALIVESALMMSAKLGTHYAAYAAVRSASVTSSTRSWGESSDGARRAAEQAMLPFASGLMGSESAGQGRIDIDELVAAHDDWAEQPAARGYLRAKASDVAQRLEVELGAAPAEWDSELTATVIYAYPFRVPGIGRLLGDRQGDVYVFPLRSRAVLHNEGPQNEQQTLGIGYGTQY